MEIDLNDTPETYHLKRRIAELERENYMLRAQAAENPQHQFYKPISDLPISYAPACGEKIILYRQASLDVLLDPMSGAMHMIGRSSDTTVPDRIVKLDYYIEKEAALNKWGASRVLCELHKRVIMELANRAGEG